MITYRKLREVLAERRIQHKVLQAISGVSPNVIAKIYKDEYMSLESLEAIAKALNLEIGDIVEIK